MRGRFQERRSCWYETGRPSIGACAVPATSTAIAVGGVPAAAGGRTIPCQWLVHVVVATATATASASATAATSVGIGGVVNDGATGCRTRPCLGDQRRLFLSR